MRAISVFIKIVFWSLIVLGGVALYDAFTSPTPVLVEVLSSPTDESFATFAQDLNDVAFDFKAPERCFAEQEKDKRCPTLVGMARASSYTQALNLKRRVLRAAGGGGVRANVDVEWEYMRYVRERINALLAFI